MKHLIDWAVGDPAGEDDSLAGPERPPRWTAVSAAELGGDESCEAGRAATGSGRHHAVDRLGAEHEPGPQACANPAALVHPPEGIWQLGQARGHTSKLQTEPAHGEEYAASNLVTEVLRQDEPHGRDGDSQTVGGGMVPNLPS